MDTGGPQHDVHPPDRAQFTGDSLFHMTCGCFLLPLFVLLPLKSPCGLVSQRK